MRRIGPYNAASVPSFDELASESTENRKEHLRLLSRAVGEACTAYDTALPNVHVLEPISIAKKQREMLVASYDARTAGIKRRLTAMIDTLPAADADLCPYCSLDTNPDLDHFLPKGVFPEFSLYAHNLVPICTPCNRRKLNAYKTETEGRRMFLHPSVEPSVNTPVIRADLIIDAGYFVVKYSVDDAGLLPPSELELVKRHYHRLKLGERYSRRAHSHLASFRASVAGRRRTPVTRTLQEKINTAPIGEPVNGWRPALYRAIMNNQPRVIDWLTTP